MKKYLQLIAFFSIALVVVSCNEKVEKDTTKLQTAQTGELADTDLKKVSLDIKGMTCEIGCARTIQSKLSKTEGVNFAEVNFDAKKGTVEFDPGKISEKQIVAVVEQIAGGELYKVSEISTTE